MTTTPEPRATSELVERTMTDHQRMLWRDDVEGICPTPDMCFEYGDHVRCGPCAIKQATARGVQTDYSVPNLPAVYRLERRTTELETALAEARAQGWAEATAWHKYGIAWKHLEKVSQDELLTDARAFMERSGKL